MAVQQFPAVPTESTSPATNSIIDQMMALAPLIIFFVIIIVLIMWFVKWITNKRELAKDIYTQDYKKTIEQCKINRTSKWITPIMGLPLWLASKGVKVWINSPLLLDSNQEVEREVSKDRLLFPSGESYVLGTYAGHCYTTDGCFTLMLKSSKDKVMGLFPKLILIKLRRRHIQKIIDPDDRKKTKEIKIPADHFTTSNDAIFITALGIEKNGNYYYAVNLTENGEIVNTKPYAYQDQIEIATQKQVLDMGKNMASLSEELARGAPLVQILKKTDSSLDQV